VTQGTSVIMRCDYDLRRHANNSRMEFVRARDCAAVIATEQLVCDVSFMNRCVRRATLLNSN